MEIYNVVKARIDANKYGKHPQNNINYMLKGKVFCGYCGRRMTSFTGESKSGKMYRYYKCPKTEPCKQSRTFQKDVLEQAITKALENILSEKDNFELLVNKILETYNGNLNDNSTLRIAQKELSKVENSLSNLLAAVEDGFYSETSKQRLKELEKRKMELKSQIAAEKGKEIKPLTKEQVTEYLSFAITQPSQILIDLLVKKVIIRDDTIDVYLKYTDDNKPSDPPKRGRLKYPANPERNISSERGFLFTVYIYSYDINPMGRKPLGTDTRPKIIKSLTIAVLI